MKLKEKIQNQLNKDGSMPKNNEGLKLAYQLVTGQINKAYLGHYSGSGRFTSYYPNGVETYLRSWGIKYKQGNDAPRGGKIGDFVTGIDGRQKIKPFLP